jgi:glycosyltransferase involved in cell wall biosynthesis
MNAASADAVPRVSVIIPCRDEVDHIETCIRSILEQESPGGDYEILAVDGGSRDGTREKLAQLSEQQPCVRVIENPSGYVAAGLNRGIQLARGEIIIRTDAHTSYAKNYLRSCVLELERSGADNVGGPARTTASTPMQKAIAAAYHSPFSVGGARFHQIGYEGYVDTVTYGCWRRETFEKFGTFDETLLRNQDDEHNLRITRGGGRIWQSPRICSWYKPRGTLKALFRQYSQYGYWKVRVIQKHRIPASFRHLVPGGFLLVLLLLGLLSPLFQFARIIFFGLILSYALALGAASLITGFRSGMSAMPRLPLVFACYHFSYGYGFLCGMADSFLLGGKLTRVFSEAGRAGKVSPEARSVQAL